MRAYTNQPSGEFSYFAGANHNCATKPDLLFELMEYYKLFLSPCLTPRKLAFVMNVDLKELERYFFDSLGLSLSQIISIYRIQHSRKLLTAGIDFYNVAQFSGFRSLRRFRNCLEAVLDWQVQLVNATFQDLNK